MPRLGRSQLLLSGWLFLVAGMAARGATRPNYDAARAFAFELQQDFAQRHSVAIIERVDESALQQKVFSAYSPEVAHSSEATSTWKNVLFPRFVDGLRSRDICLQLSFGRVLNLNGNRMLEFVLVNGNGSIEQIYWEVAEGADGRIRITDQRLSAENLSYTQRTRHLMLLSAGVPTVQVDAEERDLERACAKYHSLVTKTLAAMRDDKLEEAFLLWSGMPDDVKQTAIWRDMRMTIAVRGGALAIANVQADLKAGRPGVDPIVLYNVAMRRNDYDAALRAMDDVLVETHDSPVYRALRCDLLTRMHRARESLQAARDLYRLNPYMFAGYVQATQAAMSLEDSEAAMGVLQDWAQIYAPTKIDDFLKAQPEFEKLRSSPAYRDWLQAAAPVRAS